MQRMLLARACGEEPCGLDGLQRERWSSLGPDSSRDLTACFVESLAFIDISTPDGALLLCGGAAVEGEVGRNGASVGVFRLAGPAEKVNADPAVYVTAERVCGHELNCGMWMPDDAGLFVTGGDGTEFSVWDTACFTVAQRTSLGSPESAITALDMSAVPGAHTGVVAIARTDSPDVNLIDLATGASTHRLQGHSGHVRDVKWSSTNPHFLASTGFDGVRLFDVRRSGTMSCLVAFNEYRRLPDEHWDFQDFGSNEIQTPPSKRRSLTAEGSQHPRFIQMCTSELLGLGCAWESTSASQKRRRKRRSEVNGRVSLRDSSGYSAFRVRFTSDGTTLISSGMNGSFYIWDVHTGRLVAIHSDWGMARGNGCIFAIARDDYQLLADHRGHFCALGIDNGSVLWEQFGHAGREMSDMAVHPLYEEVYTASGTHVKCWSSDRVSNVVKSQDLPIL